MYNWDEDKSLGPLTETELQAYEAELGAALPPDYRAWLLEHNGALPEKRQYYMPGEKHWIESVFSMFGIGDASNSRSLRHYLYEDASIPEGWVPIADSGCGDYTVISVLPEDYGQVSYLFHEVFDPDDPEAGGVYLLANSFSEWLHGLEKLTED